MCGRMIILENTETGETREVKDNEEYTAPWKAKGSTSKDHDVVSVTDARGVSVSIEVPKGAKITTVN